MSKYELSGILVAVALFIAYVVRDSAKRKAMAKIAGHSASSAGEPQSASQQVSSAAQQPTEASSAGTAPAATSGTTSTSGTQRERRQKTLRSMSQGDKCIYCSSPADRPFPYPEFLRYDGDVPLIFGLPGAMLRASVAWASGDVQRQWRVVEPVDGVPVLCSSHATIARSAVEVQISKAQADLVEFISTQQRMMHEWRNHGLDEDLFAESDRVIKGGQRK